jgi:hypothetical protein
MTWKGTEASVPFFSATRPKEILPMWDDFMGYSKKDRERIHRRSLAEYARLQAESLARRITREQAIDEYHRRLNEVAAHLRQAAE